MGNENEKIKSIDRYAHLIEKQTGKVGSAFRSDGYVNLLNKYGTAKDTTEHYHFDIEPIVPDDTLTAFYEGNGMFARIIDAPAEEAVKHGFELEGVANQKIKDIVDEKLDELNVEAICGSALKWARLYGGSIGVIIANDGRGVEEPMDYRHLRSIDNIVVFDRSVIVPDYASMYSYDPVNQHQLRGTRFGMPETYHVYSRYGSFTVHESRCLIFQNGVLPEKTTNDIYRIWGEPEYIRIHRAIRDAEIAHGSAVKLLDRAIQAVYKMKDLSTELATEEGEDRVLKRLQTIDMARGLLNTITIDSEGEDYDFRTYSFSGVSEIIDASCNYLSALTNIPQTILFGRSPAGMSATGHSDFENYYNFVEQIQKRMLKKNMKYLVSLILKAEKNKRVIDKMPAVKIKFNPLWQMSDQEQAALELQKAQVQQTRAMVAQTYVGMGALDPSEVRKELASEEVFDVETMLDGMTEEELEESMPNPMGGMPGMEGMPGMGGEEPSPDAAGMMAGAGMPQGAENQPQSGDIKPTDKEMAMARKINEELEFKPTDEEMKLAEKVNEELEKKEEYKPSEEEMKLARKVNEELDEENEDGEDEVKSVGVIVVNGGKILTGRRKNETDAGMLCGPGGHIEEGETPEEAAIRETGEEFGIIVRDLIPLGNGPTEKSGLKPRIFICNEYENDPVCDEEEMTDPAFHSIKEIADEKHIFQPFADSIDLLQGWVINNFPNSIDFMSKTRYNSNGSNEDDAEFEGKHPRDEGGKFSSTGSHSNKESNNVGNSKYDKNGVYKFKSENGSLIIDSDLPIRASNSGKTTVVIKKGTPIMDVYSFAGKDSESYLRVKKFIAKQFGGKKNDWSHKSGLAKIGDKQIEVHWFENENIGQIKFKLKKR